MPGRRPRAGKPEGEGRGRGPGRAGQDWASAPGAAGREEEREGGARGRGPSSARPYEDARARRSPGRWTSGPFHPGPFLPAPHPLRPPSLGTGWGPLAWIGEGPQAQGLRPFMEGGREYGLFRFKFFSTGTGAPEQRLFMDPFENPGPWVPVPSQVSSLRSRVGSSRRRGEGEVPGEGRGPRPTDGPPLQT